MKLSKLLLLLPLPLTTLTACVEDNGDLTDALEKQNEILQQQNDLLNQQLQNNNETSSITISGTVVDFTTSEPVKAGMIRYRVAQTWSEPVAFTAGNYVIEGVPGLSDVELEISSTTDDFVTRNVFGTTRTTDDKVTYMELPAITTSPLKTAVVKISNEENANVEDVKFSASYYSSASFSQTFYNSDITYDEAQQGYVFSAPAYIFDDINVTLYRDVDGDGLEDYENNSLLGYNNSGYTTFRMSKLVELNNSFTLKKQDNSLETEMYSATITVADEALSAIENAILYTETAGGTVQATYNAETKQYNIDFDFSQNSNAYIYLASGTHGEESYPTARLRIWSDNDNFIVDYDGNVSGSSNTDYYYSIAKPQDNKFGFVITPHFSDTVIGSSDLQVLYSSFDLQSQKYSIFFNNSVEIVEQGIRYINNDHIEVVRGNDSASDLILSGTTLLNKSNVELDFDVDYSFNNTRVEITPKTLGKQGSSVRLYIDYVRDTKQDQLVSVNYYSNTESLPLVADEGEIFSIQDLVLDNNNYYDQGQLIVSENTASLAATPSQNSQSVYLYVPKTASLLKNLYVKVVGRIENGIEYAENDGLIRAINNGAFNIYSGNYHVSLASNESTTGNNTYEFLKGTSLSEGYHYRVNNSLEYMNDNTSENTNALIIEYAYETLEGELQAGTVTLPVH